jgi:hydroxymethylbilane synthase
MILNIGTRGSELALWQAHHTQEELRKFGVDSRLVIIKTQGDHIQHLGFDKMEGKGFFTKEIEDALLSGDIQLAVHSMKDLSTVQPEGLLVAAVSYRQDPADWLLIRKDAADHEKPFLLPTGARLGTSAARRKAQMLDLRSDIQVEDLRGNVPTRVDKLRNGQFDAIIMAAAGIQRLALDLSDLEVLKLYPREFIPAPAQGVIAWQTNAADLQTRQLLLKLHHYPVAACTNVERRLLQLYEGGCHLPFGAFCERDRNGSYHASAACLMNGTLRKTHYAQSTTDGLAERLFERLHGV